LLLAELGFRFPSIRDRQSKRSIVAHALLFCIPGQCNVLSKLTFIFLSFSCSISESHSDFASFSLSWNCHCHEILSSSPLNFFWIFSFILFDSVLSFFVTFCRKVFFQWHFCPISEVYVACISVCLSTG
jgi:hypothetical protein